MKKEYIYENIEKLIIVSTIKNELAFHLLWIYRVGQSAISDMKYLINLYTNCKKQSQGIDKLKFDILREIAINEMQVDYRPVEYNVLNLIYTYFNEIIKYNPDVHKY